MFAATVFLYVCRCKSCAAQPYLVGSAHHLFITFSSPILLVGSRLLVCGSACELFFFTMDISF